MGNIDYGVIGNCQSIALVSKKGSIDWCCLPSFNSSSVFASLLDKEAGGKFAFKVDKSYKTTQHYLEKTNILVTSFSNGCDEFSIYDFMPRYINGDRNYYTPPDLIRYIKLVRGKPRISIIFDPRLEYGRFKTVSSSDKDYIKSFTVNGTYNSVYLYSNLSKRDIIESNELEITEDSFLLLSYNQKILKQTVERAYLKLQRTKVYWMNWSERTVHYKKYNEIILRSALILKLLSYQKTGAILAAATTSLPETIGDVRNWDYRFCWIRDSSMVVRIMTKLGHYKVAFRYLGFILDLVPEKDEKIQIMYGINREKTLTERILPHLRGYRDSKPVRIGNAAYKQKQNDIYGVLMDALLQQFQIFDISLQHSESFWTIARGIVNIVESNWRKPDKGIWEIRSKDKHFTFSKVLCWVAVDRAIKIAELINMTDYVSKWKSLCNEIKMDIHKNAWNVKKQAFTQYYGSEDMDAANLLMEPYGFIDANDEKYIKTVLKIKEELCMNGLMFRYKNHDDIGIPTSSFTVCTFWMINSLYKIGRKNEAVKMFENTLRHGNHLGLFSEDMDFKTKRLLGNFPQAYSHIALIEAAINLSEGAITSEEKILKAIRHYDKF